jgi:holo-[acyl-carrier protein] synthase
MKSAHFSYSINIGTDIVHLPRIFRLIGRRDAKGNNKYLERFTRRILCEQEQRDFRTRFPRQPSHPIARIEPVGLRSPTTGMTVTTPTVTATPTAEMARWLAGRFAAKEAARKASPLGAASLGWKDVMVRVNEPSDDRRGRPEVVYLNPDGEAGNTLVGKLSISHDGDYVVATVLAAG